MLIRNIAQLRATEASIMDLNGVPLFSLLTDRMSWLATRQSTLAQNVANADTPGFVARDIKPMDFRCHGFKPEGQRHDRHQCPP